jgi:hypothetical protein
LSEVRNNKVLGSQVTTTIVGNKIMIKNDPQRKYGEQAYSGPFTILQVNDNGTVRYQKGLTRDTINIRNITPFHE